MDRESFARWVGLRSTPLLADGAMGTMLHAHGVPFSACFDALNLTDPVTIAEIHHGYIEAGAEIILTNTFGGNRYKLAEHGLADQVAAINQAGVTLAKRVVLAAFRDVKIAGDVGPLGVRLAPYGRVQKAEARSAFAEQIQALAEGGVDFIVIETMTDLQELLQAVRAAREVCSLPVVASMTFTRDDRTPLGDAPEIVARQLAEADVDMIGVNCSGGPEQLFRLAGILHETAPKVPLWVKPNAGWPERVGGRIRYPAGPEYFADYVWAFAQAGAKVVGGCCGTTPAHIRAMREALDKGPPAEARRLVRMPHVPAVGRTMPPDQSSRLSETLSAGRFVIAVEVDPPRGLTTHKLMAAAMLVKEAGADVVNVADSPLARMRMSPWAVCALIQEQVGIETTLHFPTRGRNLLRVQGDLLAAHALGIRNVFVVMGDPTAIGDYPEAMDNYDVVPSGLIKLIKSGFNAGIDHAGMDIGQPTSFFVGAALNMSSDDLAREVKVARRKVRAGVDFFITQPIFDPGQPRAFLKAYADRYGILSVPILIGILPLYSVRHARFLHHEVPGIAIPSSIFTRLEQAGDHAKEEGVQIAVDTIEQIVSWGLGQGVYLMPAFNRFDLIAEVITRARENEGSPMSAGE